ncbi:MAG: hypothetical protein PHV05_05305 [Candidatus Riflebacteria bacterium]|nr:hypothetical protein [Candidatus Riflebacteria bacterium]
MDLSEALKIIKEIAERFERDHAVTEVAQRIDRERRNALHAATPEGSDSGGNEAL